MKIYRNSASFLVALIQMPKLPQCWDSLGWTLESVIHYEQLKTINKILVLRQQ